MVRDLVGQSKAINEVRALIKQVAKTQVNVLITGESGSGKEVVARSIHEQSSRREKAFIPVNCGAIPFDLLESELFGHEKGAFTGAVSQRVGRFEMANGGTLFLDEIGDMPLNMQVKLLRVIQERVFERVGSSRSIKSDVRIICATHAHLEERITENKFREDLFYRINVFPIRVPSLTQRSDDIPDLIQDLIVKFQADMDCNINLTKQAYQSLQQIQWDGNVRELSNLIERLIVLYPGKVVDLHDLPKKYQSQSTMIGEGQLELENINIPQKPVHLESPVDLKQIIQELEKAYIEAALNQTQGVVAHAAEHLGLRRTTLVEKMRKYHIIRS